MRLGANRDRERKRRTFVISSLVSPVTRPFLSIYLSGWQIATKLLAVAICQCVLMLV